MKQGTVEDINWSVSKFGDDMVKITIDDEIMSTFDAGIIKAARSIEEGDEIEYDFTMSGKYKNLSHLNGVDAAPKKGKSGSVAPSKGKKPYTGGDRDFVKEGRDKTMSILSVAVLQGYVAHHGEMPTGEWMHAAGVRLSVYVMKIVEGQFFMKNKDEDIKF